MSLTVSLPPQAQAPVSAIVSAQRKQGKRKRKFGRKLCLHDAGEARRAVAQALRMWLGSGAQEGQRPEPERLGPGGARRGRGLPQGLGCMLLRVDSRMLRGRPPDSVRNGDASEHQRSAPHKVCSTHSLALRPRLRSWLQPLHVFRLPQNSLQMRPLVRLPVSCAAFDTRQIGGVEVRGGGNNGRRDSEPRRSSRTGEAGAGF